MISTSFALMFFTLAQAEPPASPRFDLLVVQGAGGTPEYRQQFGEWSATWRQVAAASHAGFTLLGGDDESSEAASDRDQLAEVIRQHLKERQRPLWIVMFGHGTDDRRSAKFNLRGPDISAQWLADQLKPCERPLAVICCFSSSAPFLNRLSAPNRVVITATRSGAERNYSRFGGFLAAALAGAANEADLDKDEQTSLLEAFLLASKRTQQFYADDNRLASEHALMDDNGDQRGTPADWFHGIRPVKSPKDGALDGMLANQMVLTPSARESRASADFISNRDALEKQIATLRSQRGQLADDEYYRQLEQLMLPLAKLYGELE